ncbi:MAG TPA: hypothetical protein VFS43_37510 [Polyangiaceae bacterium]|nr:hypothetical protein [Polyangiaceae bacterium]
MRGAGGAFELLDAVADAGGAAAREAERFFSALPPLPEDAFSAALRIRQFLARRGFRDLPDAFTLPEMLARRGGNCLGLTLLVGAALVERGHRPAFLLGVNPADAVHHAGAAHFALLADEREGVDADARLPDAADCGHRFRFAPVEHASLLVAGAGGAERPFEATGFGPGGEGGEPGWSPPFEARRRASFEELAAVVLSERAKALAWRGGAAPGRAALRLALRSVRRWPGNREGWAELFRRAAGRPAIERLARERYRAFGDDDSLFHFTLYRMTGEPGRLARAIAAYPQYAEAHYERHVRPWLEAGGEPGRPEACRHFAVVAWCHAESEVLDLRAFYEAQRDAFVRLYSAAEFDEIMGTFGGG